MPDVETSTALQQKHDDLLPPTRGSAPPPPPPPTTPPKPRHIADAESAPPPAPAPMSQPPLQQPNIQAQLNDAAAQLGEAGAKLKTQAMPIISELAKHLPKDANKRRAVIIAASVVGGLMLMSCCCCSGLFLIGTGDTQVAGSNVAEVAASPVKGKRITGPIRSKYEVRDRLRQITFAGAVTDQFVAATCKQDDFLKVFGRPESDVGAGDNNQTHRFWKFSFRDGSVVMEVYVMGPPTNNVVVQGIDMF